MNIGMRRELAFLVWALIVILLVGALFGQILLFLFVALLSYIGWTLYNLALLIGWLAKPTKHTPETWGVWEDIFYQLYHLHRRNRKAKKKLTKMLNRFQKSTQALPYATIVLNASNEIEWFNPAARQMFGFQQKRDVGQRIDNLIRHPSFSSYLAKMKFDEPLDVKLDQQHILLNITPYASGQYLVSARDITQRQQLDDMRRDFISNASHELRTPITVMSGYVEMLRETETEAMSLPLQKIQQQTQRMEDIITELIGLARLETAEAIEIPETVDSEQLLKEVYEEALALDNGRHDISLVTEPVKLLGKYEELRMAFSNLMTNAIRYTPDGKSIELFTQADETGVNVCVKDQGIGIEYEHIPRLTERFYRVDEGRSREVGGTGLGLSIVNQVLERHGASLRIESVPGKGSVFCCYFPASTLLDE